GSGLKPSIEDFRGPFHRAAARTCIRHRIEIFLMKIPNLVAGALFNFLNGTEHFAFFTGSAFPYWNWRGPIPVARNIPVACIRQPLSETSILDCSRIPLDFLIALDQANA